MPVTSQLLPGVKVFTPHQVANSLRFNDGSSDYLVRTPSSSGNRQTFTISFWYKRTTPGTSGSFIRADNGSGIDGGIRISTDSIQFFDYNSSYKTNLVTTQLLRDVSAWYHIVCVADTTNSTSGDRALIYLNGTRITDFSSETYPTQNLNFSSINDSSFAQNIGRSQNFATYLDGYLAEFCFIDGQALTPTSFGEFDSITNIWKPKDVSGLTFGTNGFYLDFENSSSLGADVSGNGNNFTVNNLTSVDQSTDTCTNNFATLNPLNGNNYAGLTFSEGNLKVTTTAGQYAPAQSTIGFNTGKWYAEFKATDVDNWTMVGIVGQNATATSQPVGYFSDGYGYIGGSSAGGSNSKMNNNSASSYASTYADGDIISVAVDCDNNKLYFGLNGTWLNSGNPESGSSGTGAAFTISSSPTSGFYHFAVGNWSGSQTPDWEANFGSPPYAISSGNSDAEGFGNFEYAVPSGYFALCSKNLAEYG